MSQKIEINIKAIDDASSKIDSMAKNIDRSLDDVNRSSDEVVRKQKDLERAVTSTADNSSRKVDTASREIDSDFDGINRSSDDVVVNQRELERAVEDTADNSSRKVDTASREINRNYDDVNRSADDVVSKQGDLERAIDDVSRNAAGDVDTAAKEITKDYADVGRAADEVKAKHTSMGEGTKDVAIGFSGIVTAGYSLYDAYDRVSDMTLQVDKANLKVTVSANSLEDAERRQTDAGTALKKAQEELAVAIETYGADSDEAAKATEVVNQKLVDYQAKSDDAKISTERYDMAVQTAKQTQDNFNEAIVKSALQVVPTLVTAIDSGSKLWKSLDNLGGEAGILKAISTKLGDVNTGFSNLKGVGALAIPVTVVIAAVWAIQQAFNWLKESVIYPNAPGLKEFEQLQPPVLGGVRLPGKQGGGWVGLGGPEIIRVGEAGSEYIVPHHKLGGIVPWKQHGGIFDKPTIIGVGEAGPEAVVPLDRMAMGSSIVNYYDIRIFVDAENSRIVEAKIANALKSVIIKTTSVAAPTEQKSIAVGNTFSAPTVHDQRAYAKFGR